MRAIWNCVFHLSLITLLLSSCVHAQAQHPADAAALIVQLKSADSSTRQAARLALLRSGATAIPALTIALKDSDNFVRQSAAESLGEVGSPAQDAVPVLLPLVQDPSPSVRLAAVGALGQIDPTLAASARTLLWAVSLPDGAPLLPGLLGSMPGGGSEDVLANELATELLSAPEARPAVMAALKDPSDVVRAKGVEILGSDSAQWSDPSFAGFVPDQVLTLTADPSATVRAAVGSALSSHVSQLDPRTQAHLVSGFNALLSSEDSAVRDQAILDLTDMGPLAQAAVPPLTMMVSQNKDVDLRLEVLEALESIAPHSEAIVSTLTELLQDNDGFVKEQAAEALVTAGAPAVASLKPLTTSANQHVRSWADDILKSIATPAAAAALRSALADANPQIRDDAEKAQPVPVTKVKAAIVALVPTVTFSLQPFPWPPPQPKEDYLVPASLLGGNNQTLAQVCSRLTQVLDKAGYPHALMAVPGGFAVVTRVEQIMSDGTPLANPQERFTDVIPSLTDYGIWGGLREYVHRLLFQTNQSFRLFVFVVTPYHPQDTHVKFGYAEAYGWYKDNEDKQLLPPNIGIEKFRGRYCDLLIYQFGKSNNSHQGDVVPSVLPPLTHFIKSGIQSAFLGGSP